MGGTDDNYPTAVCHLWSKMGQNWENRLKDFLLTGKKNGVFYLTMLLYVSRDLNLSSDCSQITPNSSTSNYPSWYAKFGSSIHRPLGSNSLMALVWSGRRNRFSSGPGLDRSENSMLVLARFLLIQSGSIRGFLVWMQHFLVTRLYRKNRNWNRFQV